MVLRSLDLGPVERRELVIQQLDLRPMVIGKVVIGKVVIGKVVIGKVVFSPLVEQRLVTRPARPGGALPCAYRGRIPHSHTAGRQPMLSSSCMSRWMYSRS